MDQVGITRVQKEQVLSWKLKWSLVFISIISFQTLSLSSAFIPVTISRRATFQHKSIKEYNGISHAYANDYTGIRKNIRRSTLLSLGSNSHQNDSPEYAPSDETDSLVIETGSRILNPLNVLYPFFHPVSHVGKNEKICETSSTNISNTNTQVTLDRALQMLSQTMNKILSKGYGHDSSNLNVHFSEIPIGLNNDIGVFLESILGGSLWTRNSFDEKMNQFNNTKSFTIRIEQEISHDVDPLCWLHANIPSQPSVFQKSVAPVLFFGNAEGTMDAAVYGSSRTISSLMSNNKNGSKEDDDNWSFINSLPKGSRVYGGGRFDTNVSPSQQSSYKQDQESQSYQSNDWDEFGKAFWILPSIELRREKSMQGTDIHSNKNWSDRGLSGDGRHKTTLLVHLSFNSLSSLLTSAKHVLDLLSHLTHKVSPPTPSTTLPPIISRGNNEDVQEVFENGVNAALEQFKTNEHDSSTDDVMEKQTRKMKLDSLRKVVLARRMDLHFEADLSGLDILMNLKFTGHVGHLIFLCPGGGTSKEFLGCTPERLFKVQSKDGIVISEALAGTRPRGTTTEDDEALLNDLVNSEKDQMENSITGSFIKDALHDLEVNGLLEKDFKNDEIALSQQNRSGEYTYIVRRLRYLQHICQNFRKRIKDKTRTVEIARSLLQKLHPTPAVCGLPVFESLNFIQSYEAQSFDRGMYSGPFGYLGHDSDVLVGIRSALLTRNSKRHTVVESGACLSTFAGAGIVPGSSVQEEWSEISIKLGAMSSVFPQSPLLLTNAPTSNVAFATAFIEELIRSGVTQFYVCPGSRSTPLTAAIARAVRTHVGIVNAVSVHDERSAGFRALGFTKATNRVSAVITSSGTAVANLYPAVIEAGMDGVPILILTADRPYEARETGANQAIDQTKIFSSSYIRWFRDIVPPSKDIPVSLALSDAHHAVQFSKDLMGPVHVNVQFRENLAPDSGPARNDKRIGSLVNFESTRFTDVPGFKNWANTGKKWINSYPKDKGFSNTIAPDGAAHDVANLIYKSKRGIIVVGNVRETGEKEGVVDYRVVSAVISEFAQAIGFPIFAGAQSAYLRFHSAAVVPYDQLLKHPKIKRNLKPDLIIQIGSPLISTEIQEMILDSLKNNDAASHVLVHPHHPVERADPFFTVTHKISSDPVSLLKSVQRQLDLIGASERILGSELTPLVKLGRKISQEMPFLIHNASQTVVSLQHKYCSETDDTGRNISPINNTLTEPQIILAMSEVIAESSPTSLFLSNSLPVRDTESFLYPGHLITETDSRSAGLSSVSVNRGASGIDGVTSSAIGFAEGVGEPTTLLIGDLATIHDLNAFHSLKGHGQQSKHAMSNKQSPHLTTIIVNNNGGGIFSFLPIAKHGADVGFEEFFGTPTDDYSFSKGAQSFGIDFDEVSSYKDFKKQYKKSFHEKKSTIIEAKVVGRTQNVAVHAEISKCVIQLIDRFLEVENRQDYVPYGYFRPSKLPAKIYAEGKETLITGSFILPKDRKTVVLLHGWMGDKNDWDDIGLLLSQEITKDWNIVSIDMPGHGSAPSLVSEDHHLTRIALEMDNSFLSANKSDIRKISVDNVAQSVIQCLHNDYGLDKIDVLCGYSLGGRVALAMKRLSSQASDLTSFNFGIAKLILLGSDPGDNSVMSTESKALKERYVKDFSLSQEMIRVYNSLSLFPEKSRSYSSLKWVNFLSMWYSNSSLWGNLKTRKPVIYSQMLSKRAQSLSNRAPDLAQILLLCSPGQDTVNTNYLLTSTTLDIDFIAGSLDEKYSSIGKKFSNSAGVQYSEIPHTGHALLIEAPYQVTKKICNAINNYISSEVLFVTGLTNNLLKKDISPEFQNSMVLLNDKKISTSKIMNEEYVQLGNIDLEIFTIDYKGIGNDDGLVGVGWGGNAEDFTIEKKIKNRKGFIISISSQDNSVIGIGEVSPLDGVHTEDIDDVKGQLDVLIKFMKLYPTLLPLLECKSVLRLDGSLTRYINVLLKKVSSKKKTVLTSFTPSMRAGLEMALLSLAAQVIKVPLPHALIDSNIISQTTLPLNGIITRGALPRSNIQQKETETTILYSSIKVKVGHQSRENDIKTMRNAMEESRKYTSLFNSHQRKSLRADANRLWDKTSAINFASSLKQDNIDIFDTLEFIEEPLQKELNSDGVWELSRQISELEELFQATGIKYALDESLADIVMKYNHDYESIIEPLRQAMWRNTGCAAFVLKPTLLGLELSYRLAKLAHNEFGIGAVFSSTFDSGVGLAYISFLAAVSDSQQFLDNNVKYSHGISTFSLLNGDTLSPPFESYVLKNGNLNVVSLGKAISGIGIKEMKDTFTIYDSENKEMKNTFTTSDTNVEYQTDSSISSNGREINILSSLSLPFSSEIAHFRFTDLPQLPRWSPWLNSVTYSDDGKETEWKMSVKGFEFQWSAVSKLYDNPKGIMWESTSGLKNKGSVEFITISQDECIMKVQISIFTPRIIGTIFRSTTQFAKGFVQDKLLKWSLESFRDLIKADLALERGDSELGDALFNAIEGRTQAIEANLQP